MANDATNTSASFCAMSEGTVEDWTKISVAKKQYNRGLPDRILGHLKMLEGEAWGFPVDRFTHSLQSGTLAHRAGMDEEYVVCALLHDIGYTVGPHNHSNVAATILQPFVSARNLWMIARHNIFEGYYFYQYFGRDRNAREQFRGHPCFEQTAHFCEAFDQTAFESEFDTMPLEAFVPMVHRVLGRRRRAGAKAKS